MASGRLALVVAACQVWACAGGPGFPESVLETSANHSQQAAFLDELEELLGLVGRKSAQDRVSVTQELLRTTFVAMPKTAQGRLSKAGARYVMHRLFVQRHGWHIKGVAPMGGPWQPSSPVLGLGVDSFQPRLRVLLEERYSGEDFSLREVALLVVAIEAMIHSEAIGRLQATYKVFEKDPRVSLDAQEAEDMIYLCITAYLTGSSISSLSRAELEATCVLVEEGFPQWKATHSLIRKTLQTAAPKLERFAFSDVAHVMEVVNENMGHRVDEGACQDVEDKLIEVQESAGSGRVRLADFYTSYLEKGTSQFNERAEYLRQQGALDESDPQVPRIIIPNYMTMASNCMNISSYYDLCCIDLCEDLLETLELDIKAPQASPEQIMRVLGAAESAYVRAGRVWSEGLANKLHEVAAHHKGKVPLHGRLFAQWLHFAYPNECPYPHLSGATKPETSTEWRERTGSASAATKEEMLAVINGTRQAFGPSKCDGSEDGMCMWAPEEELVDAANWHAAVWSQATAAAAVAAPTSSVLSGLRVCAFAALLLSSGVAMRNLLRQVNAAMAASEGGDVVSQIAKLRSSIRSKAKGEAFNV